LQYALKGTIQQLIGASHEAGQWLVPGLYISCKTLRIGLVALGIRFLHRYSDNVVSVLTTDPALSAFDLPLCRTFYPLGYPLLLRTNSHDVLEAAEDNWGAFEWMFHQDPVQLCLGVAEGGSVSPTLETAIRVREQWMSIVADRDNYMLCDFTRGFAFGWVTRNMAADHALLRYHFLTAAGIALAQQRAFAPLHGALVVRNDTGVLLCGDSCAGKSTLAYACARAGWSYVTDDGTFLVRGRDGCYAVGDHHSIRFRLDAPGLFPELAGREPVLRPNGKLAIEVRTCDLSISTVPGSTVDHIVFLDRVPCGPATVHRYSEDRALEYWAQYAILGPGDIRAAQQRCYERLLQARLWKLRYSSLDDAVARLEQLVDQNA
jgi:hypothetical protein